MKRSDLEHLIRAAAAISEDSEIVIIGSQAILGSIDYPPMECVRSIEADLYPKNFPDRADLIDGSISEESPFHHFFGYYAHGVGPETSDLPQGWKQRAHIIETVTARGICPEIHDLALSKYVAGREKDIVFCTALLRERLIDPTTLKELILNER